MKWKLILTSLLVVIAGVVFWLFNGWINQHALAVAAGEQYTLKAEGWSMLLSAWPLAVGAIAPGLVFGFLIAMGLLGFADDADKAELKVKLSLAQEQAKKADARATERAQKQLQNEIMHAQQQQTAALMAQELAEATESEASEMIVRAQKQIEQAQTNVKHAQIEASRAKRKAENRKHAMLRHKTKAQRLQ